MEVILSAAFGIKSESQTNPGDMVTSYAKRAIDPKPYPSMAVMIPLIGKKISKMIAVSSWGFDFRPLIDLAKTIIKGRREDETRSRRVSLVLLGTSLPNHH